jgi:hypothetical protein
MQKLFRSLIAVGGLAGLVACGDDVSVTAPPTPDLAISGAPVTAVQVGAKVQLSANQAVTWASSAANVATVDGTGLVTAVTAGTASITATATADVNKKASVTITVTAPAVRSVEVSPSFVTMNPGGTQGFVANVDADPGVARTVTWTSSNNAVVTVTSAGVATAVAPGAATITATSTVATSVAGAASVTVRTPIQPRVSIQKVTVAGNLNAPVNLAAAAGQIDVTIDVDPGDFIATKVELLVDGVVVGSQNFTAQQSTDLTNAHAFADLAEAVASTVISFNTAAFDPVTGAVAAINKNGPHLLSARLTVTGGGAGTATPSSNLAITFLNADTFLQNLTYTGTVTTANDAAGLKWNRGGLTVDVIPIVYTPGVSIGAGGTVTFGQGCDLVLGNRTQSLTQGTGTAWTASFAQTSNSGALTSNVVNYEMANGCALNGEFVRLTASDNLGNALFNATIPVNAAAGIRLDNRAPATPALTLNVNGRSSGWVNDVVVFNKVNTGSSGTANNMVAAAIVDGGVGLVVYPAKMAPLASGNTVANAVTATDIATSADATAASFAISTDNFYCLVIYAQDALGNRSSSPSSTSTAVCGSAGNHTTIGIDRDAPTGVMDDETVITGILSLAANARIAAATVGNEFRVLVNDGSAAAIGVSGFGPTPLRAKITRRDATNTAVCVVGSGSSCSLTTTGQTFTAPNAQTSAMTAMAIPGYYTFDGDVTDAAGNRVTLPTSARVIAFDLPANIPVLTSASFPVPLTGQNVTFTAFGSDNIDLWKIDYNLAYGGGLVWPIVYPTTIINTFNAPTLLNNNVPATANITNFYRQVQSLATPAIASISGQFKPTTLNGNLFDFAGNQSGNVATNIPAGAVTTGNPYQGVVAADLISTWQITNAATNVSNGNFTACAAGPASTATSVVLTAVVAGPPNTFSQPFTRVDFYVDNSAATAPATASNFLVLAGSATAPALNDNGVTRTYTYSFSFAPGSTYGCAVAGLPMYAVGVNAAGDALVTPLSAVISIVNP